MVTILFHGDHFTKFFVKQFTTLYGDQTELALYMVSNLFPAGLHFTLVVIVTWVIYIRSIVFVCTTGGEPTRESMAHNSLSMRF